MAAPLDPGPTPARTVVVVDARGTRQRELRVGPLPEPGARALAGLLLGRHDPVEDAGPWRCAVPGGHRSVSLEP